MGGNRPNPQDKTPYVITPSLLSYVRSVRVRTLPRGSDRVRSKSESQFSKKIIAGLSYGSKQRHGGLGPEGVYDLGQL